VSSVIKTDIRPPSTWPPSKSERERIAWEVLARYGDLRSKRWAMLITRDAVYVGPHSELYSFAKEGGFDLSEYYIDPWLLVPNVFVPSVPVSEIRRAIDILLTAEKGRMGEAYYAGRLVLYPVEKYYRPDLGGFAPDLWRHWDDSIKRSTLDYIVQAIKKIDDEETLRKLLEAYNIVAKLYFERRVLGSMPPEASKAYEDSRYLTSPLPELTWDDVLKIKGKKPQEAQQAKEEQQAKEVQKEAQTTQGAAGVEVRVVPETVRKVFEIVISMRPLQPEVREKKRREEEKLRAKA